MSVHDLICQLAAVEFEVRCYKAALQVVFAAICGGATPTRPDIAAAIAIRHLADERDPSTSSLAPALRVERALRALPDVVSAFAGFDPSGKLSVSVTGGDEALITAVADYVAAAGCKVAHLTHQGIHARPA